MSVKYTDIRPRKIVIPGLQKSYRFLHITDAHILLYDENETPDRADYAAPRVAMFAENGISTTRRLDAIWTYIEENAAQLDGVLLTGDILDYPSEPNLAYLRVKLDKLEQLSLPYVFVVGNHDWAYFNDYHTPHSKQADLPRFAAFSGGNTLIHKQRIGEVTFIALDNTEELYADGLAEALEQALQGEENVLLMQHIPLCVDTLVPDTVSYWNRDINIGATGIQKNENWKKVQQLILAPQSPVKALITGHLHFWHMDMLGGKTPQYITANAANGSAALFTVCGE